MLHIIKKRGSSGAKRMNRGLQNFRSRKKGSMAEFPLAIFALFLVFVFPLINLGSCALRYSLLMNACQTGARAAASASTFGVGSTDKPSASDLAPIVVQNAASKFSGLHVNDVDISIVSVNMTTNEIIKYPGKLSSPANTKDNLYFVEVSVLADLDPLVPVYVSPLWSVPGLNKAWTTRLVLREFVENAQGLDD